MLTAGTRLVSTLAHRNESTSWHLWSRKNAHFERGTQKGIIPLLLEQEQLLPQTFATIWRLRVLAAFPRFSTP